MSDRRPDRVYGILVRDERVFLVHANGGFGLPGGEFRRLAGDRKVELAAHIHDQLGIEVRSIWAQGAFEYQDPAEQRQWFSGFYSVWEFEGTVPKGSGEWLDARGVAASPLDPRVKILLTSLLDTKAMKTT